MSQVNKPIILDETGQSANQKIQQIGNELDENKDALSQRLTELGLKIDQRAESDAQSLAAIGEKIDALSERLPSIIEAMDRLDIIYYVENE